MQTFSQKAIGKRQGKKSGIGLALVIAFVFHVLILILPLTGKTPAPENTSAQIEVQLTTFTAPSPLPLVEAMPPEPVPEQEPEQEQEPKPEPVESIVETKPAIEAIEPEPVPVTPLPKITELRRDVDSMTDTERRSLTNTILSRQFITEVSAADKIFGKPFEPISTASQKDFHYPIRPDLLDQLNRPMQELPFAYTHDLVYFAYDPGVKGDLQRFWDVITPEFGWKTKNGTEVRCIWVLVIVGCGWK